jgi:predicted helicase
VIDFDKDKLRRRILQFRDKKLPDEIIAQAYELNDKSSWRMKSAREALMRDSEWEKSFTRILYRPFDERYIFFHDTLIERSRKDVMQHMLHANLGLIMPKRV